MREAAQLSLHTTIYSSHAMLERRRRVLMETRKLLEERGYDKFSTRELCARSNIAIRTFYHVFGSKDHVVAQSIYSVVCENGIKEDRAGDPNTFEGVLTRVVLSANGSIGMRAYAAAVMSVYGAVPGFPEIRAALRDACYTFVKPYVDHLGEMGALRPEVSVDQLVRTIKTIFFAQISDWCVGEIDDDQLIDGYAENLMSLIATAATGYVQLEAEHWLQAVRTRSDQWLQLRASAEAAQVLETSAA